MDPIQTNKIRCQRAHNLLAKQHATRQVYCVRIGSAYSHDRALKEGVPKDSPLSLVLFSIVPDDFLLLRAQGETYLFAGNVEFHIHGMDERLRNLFSPHFDTKSHCRAKNGDLLSDQKFCFAAAKWLSGVGVALCLSKTKTTGWDTGSITFLRPVNRWMKAKKSHIHSPQDSTG